MVDTASHRPGQIVDHFFRHETGRLHGALVRILGVRNLALAEDIAQEALLRALRVWTMGGVPPNPSAWITKVAMNLAKDALRHRGMSESKETAILTHFEQIHSAAATTPEHPAAICDDTLRLLFVCCHPLIAPDAQVILALKVLCGFGVNEIAQAFLSSESAIEKQLTRTKARIQVADLAFELPEGADLSPRLDGVLAALYLMFNEGYKASAGPQLLREDLCHEAIRLTDILVAHPAGDVARAHALLALMLLSTARFPSRLDANGDPLRLEEQDRTKWDAGLISRGLEQLVLSANGGELSEYHLEAGIAAVHSTSRSAQQTDWDRIVRHYDALNRIKPSPIVALNRAVAVAHLDGPKAGLDALEEIPQRNRVDSLYLLHAVTGELNWRLGRHAEAAESFRKALKLAKVGPEQQCLARMLERSLTNDVRGTLNKNSITSGPSKGGGLEDQSASVFGIAPKTHQH